ncbi:hypothetical protein CAEBREN_21995 [Caenorhabditis brenneri]|uniref:Uncharacterized protein n=1 Tax=Caenorhabditis brenneri TaxID=135651 RepID=G0N6S9_CAEBE|nr:hypothetical protein CAEBREN_21995 [Caenorhabditis brenneri]
MTKLETVWTRITKKFGLLLITAILSFPEILPPGSSYGTSTALTIQSVLPAQSLVNNLSTEQSISSLILHQTVLQQQQQNSLQALLGGQTTTQPPVDVLSMIRLQQQAAALAAALQAAGVQLPVAAQPAPAPVSLPRLHC